jgi:hypothetical protein
MNKFKLFILLNIILFLTSCGSAREGFSNQRKDNSDEFLVEKKSPLVMPPEFNELPKPESDITEVDSEEDVIKKLITKDQSIIFENNENNDENLEDLLLKKIKKN